VDSYLFIVEITSHPLTWREILLVFEIYHQYIKEALPHTTNCIIKSPSFLHSS
jgi:hypothetical protein